jgi:anthranilate/para-aminobenzoate synthase component I
VNLQATRHPATRADVDAALVRLDTAPGMYFGVDAGIAGLHPLQALLVDAPALAVHVAADRLSLQALSPLGTRLLSHRLAEQVQAAGHPLAGLRALQAALGHSPNLLLQGALRFNAHLLAHNPQGLRDPVGVLYLAGRWLERDATGQWWRLQLLLPDDADGAAADATAPAAIADDAHATKETPEPADDWPPGGYARMVEGALAVLRSQPLLSLTLSQSYRRRSSTPASTGFARLRQANPAPASFFLNDGQGTCLFGASPDLQMVVRDGAIESLPVCGTVARQPGAVGEAASTRELLNEEVDAASLAVCTDALRSDLAPLCVPGSLHLSERRRPMSLATVVHAVDRLKGRLRPGCDAWDAIAATAAPVMVTGTPRALALPAIAALEASPRGWYGGLAVQVRGNGDALVGTLLRAAALKDGVAEVRTGGDLLADSDPQREEQESRLKSQSLWRALGLTDNLPATPGMSVNPTDGNTGAAMPPEVRWECAGDPLQPALQDVLQALGVAHNLAASVWLFSGSTCDDNGQAGCVAVGDAALRMLQTAGFPVQPVAPEHGRVLRAMPTAEAPWPSASPFFTARYATLALTGQAVDPAAAGWQVWLRDEAGQPLMLASLLHRRVALLFRPDSLMSDTQALTALQCALVFAATDPAIPTQGTVATAT